MTINGSAHSVISLFEIYTGSVELKYCREYAQVVSVLMYSHASTDREIKNENILERMHLADYRIGITIAANGSKTFCIPLVSGII